MIRISRLVVATVGLVALCGVARAGAIAESEVACRLPGNDTVKTSPDVCRKLGGTVPAAETAAGESLYGIWQANNRTRHETAYAAALTYLKNFPTAPHVRELQAWAQAYEKVVRSGVASRSAPRAPATAAAEPSQVEIVFWQSVATSSDAADFEDYLQRYPDGAFVTLARRRASALHEADAQSAPSPAPGKTLAAAPSPSPTTELATAADPRALETITIDGVTYVRGREPKTFAAPPPPPR